MELITLRQFAEDRKITYEAVRKQVMRYGEELEGHVIIKNRIQYLDETAVKFLKEKRKESPIILVTENQNEKIKDLNEQIESLKAQLMNAQNELLKAQGRIIELQDETMKTIEERAKYAGLLEDNRRKDDMIEGLQRERDEARAEAGSFYPSLFGFYRKR